MRSSALLLFIAGTALLCTSRLCGAQQIDDNSLPPPASTTQLHLVDPAGLREAGRSGWHTDFIGAGRGVFDVSAGMKLWPTRFYLRNLTFGGAMDLAPGIRIRLGMRRSEGQKHLFQVDTDEAYLEAFNRYNSSSLEGGISLKLGRVRYLHFPYPDAISEFDQVPGISDLYGGAPTDYRNVVLEGEAALHSGFGVHFTGLAYLLTSSPHADVVEAYGFYRHEFGDGWNFESRLGAIAVRHEPLGRAGQPGVDLYLARQIGEFNVGLLYEHKRTEHEYAGIMVQFRPGSITRLLGKVSFDYSRRPEGFTVQLPIYHGRINESRFTPHGYVLVGEVRAVRIRTLWQQGFTRNEYEHRVDSWGDTGSRGLKCVVKEQPWYLQGEALVSPHLVPGTAWERDRQGPGQFVQLVTYRFYKLLKKGSDSNA